MAAREHLFECQLQWTGAERGPARDLREYSRDLRVDFDGKSTLLGSAAPAFFGNPSRHNPEDLLMAALVSCHCLTYLAECARGGVVVVAYEDRASGTLSLASKPHRFTAAVLRPRVTVEVGSDLEKARALHEQAHHGCFIANSLNFPVTIEPTVLFAQEVL